MKRNARGFSLIEVIISMTIFLIVMGAVYQVLRIALIQRNTVSTRIDAVKSARIALNYIRRDAINAGLSYHSVGGKTQRGFATSLVGIARNPTAERDTLTAIVAGDNVSANTLNTGTAMDSVGFVTRDLAFNDGKTVNIVGTETDGQNVIVNTGANPTRIFNAYDLYLLEIGDTKQTVGLATKILSNNSFALECNTSASRADSLNVNQSATGIDSDKSLLAEPNIRGTLKKINLVTYSIGTDGTLLRRTYGNNTGQSADEQIQTSELIYNVQNFQVSYLMDNGISTANPSFDAEGKLTPQNLNRIIQMEISITVLPSVIGLQISTPVTMKEVISARNLRYTVN